ncbi:hypothetical protein JOD29_000791 [Lysinibacillus composti]|uniref:Uncharacterized protein n=1 Tax=Lysinibacillus composti TaxID=720633 RepID=A0A3N9UIX5_9BACI|nr:hypothetical protein [Lysinibacillus composti]MBM7607547.1 hypothetical protein [Lysinibacillus composti]RQW75947.1 hypothetical protein EBB45_04840 [Lysinibacillus composti]
MDHTKMVETWAIRFAQTGDDKHQELLQKSKRALNEMILVFEENNKKLREEYAKQFAALQEIADITENLGQFNPTYERIHNIARKGLEAE